MGDGNISNGYSPEEINFVMENTGLGFCLDVGHCFCAANALKVEPFEYLNRFMQLKPDMYHLTDNEFNSPFDKHYHFGQGNYDIERILTVIPEDSLVTIETNKDFKDNLSDFVKDIEVLKGQSNAIL